MKSDQQIRDDVEAELDWDPSFDSRKIGVAVKNGVVTLSGHVDTYPDRWAAQKAAQSVAGVKAIANEIAINLPLDARRSDSEVAAAALTALESNQILPADALQIAVQDGWITLSGQVKWWYQKNAAENSLRYLRGVRGISNKINIKSPATKVSATTVRSRIESAFQRHAHRDAQKIHVIVGDGTVTLEGEVPTWQEREEAEAAAWSAPGVARVDDRLVVRS